MLANTPTVRTTSLARDELVDEVEGLTRARKKNEKTRRSTGSPATRSDQGTTPVSLETPPPGYAQWLGELKERIQSARLRATVAVNRELKGWGTKVIPRLAHDLRTAFPEMRGFSPRNLKYMRSFAEAWPEREFVQQAAAQLPWFHLCTLIDKVGSREEREWYVARAAEQGWSRSVLVMQIESGAMQREGRAVTNFDAVLPKPHSDL